MKRHAWVALVGIGLAACAGNKSSNSTTGGASDGGSAGTTTGVTAGADTGADTGTDTGTTAGTDTASTTGATTGTDTASTPDTTPPTVVISPTNGSTVASNGTFTLQFSEAVIATTIDSTSVTIEPPVVGAISYDASTHTVTVTPTDPLPNGQQYKVSVSDAITDLAGNALAPVGATFIVAAAAAQQIDDGGAALFRQLQIAMADDGSSGVAAWIEQQADAYVLRYSLWDGTDWTVGTVAQTLTFLDTFSLVGNDPVGGVQSFVLAVNRKFTADFYVHFAFTTATETFVTTTTVLSSNRDQLLVASSSTDIALVSAGAGSSSRPQLIYFNGASFAAEVELLTNGSADNYSLIGAGGSFLLAMATGASINMNQLTYVGITGGLPTAPTNVTGACGEGLRNISSTVTAANLAGDVFLILCRDSNTRFARISRAASVWSTNGTGDFGATGTSQMVASGNNTNFVIAMNRGGLNYALLSANPIDTITTPTLLQLFNGADNMTNLRTASVSSGHALVWDRATTPRSARSLVHIEAEVADFLHDITFTTAFDVRLVGHNGLFDYAYLKPGTSLPTLAFTRFDTADGNLGDEVEQAAPTRGIASHALVRRGSAVALGWFENRDVKVKRAVAQAAATVATAAAASAVDASTFIAHAAGDVGLVVWQQGDGAGLSLYSREVAADGTMGAITYASSRSFYQGFNPTPLLVSDGSRFLMVYRGSDDAGARSLFARIYEGGAWSAEQLISTDSGQPVTPFVWQGHFGFVYQRQTSAPRSVRVLLEDTGVFDDGQGLELDTTVSSELTVSAYPGADDVAFTWSQLGPSDEMLLRTNTLTSTGLGTIHDLQWCASVSICSTSGVPIAVRDGNTITVSAAIYAVATSFSSVQAFSWDTSTGALGSAVELSTPSSVSGYPHMIFTNGQLTVAWQEYDNDNAYFTKAKTGASLASLGSTVEVQGSTQVQDVMLGVDDGVVTAFMAPSNAGATLPLERLVSNAWSTSTLARPFDYAPAQLGNTDNAMALMFVSSDAPRGYDVQRIFDGAALGGLVELFQFESGDDFYTPSLAPLGPNRFAAVWMQAPSFGGHLFARFGL